MGTGEGDDAPVAQVVRMRRIIDGGDIGHRHIVIQVGGRHHGEEHEWREWRRGRWIYRRRSRR